LVQFLPQAYSVLTTEVKRSFVDECLDLHSTAVSSCIELTDTLYSNFLALVRTVVIERSIDFERVNQEQEQLVLAVASEFAGSEVEQLFQRIQRSVAERSPKRIWTYFQDLFEHHGDCRQRFSAAAEYAEYIRLWRAIDLEELSREKDKLVREIRRRLIEERKDKRLQDIGECLDAVILLRDMFAVHCPPHRYQEYLPFEGEGLYSPTKDSGVRVLTYQVRSFADPGDPPLEYLDLALERRQSAFNFYITARDRANAMLDNTRRLRREFKRKVAMLVAGGFHTTMIEHRLKEEFKEPYAVITPRITSEEQGHDEKYRRRIAESTMPMHHPINPV
jgi:hypothetical protein